MPRATFRGEAAAEAGVRRRLARTQSRAAATTPRGPLSTPPSPPPTRGRRVRRGPRGAPRPPTRRRRRARVTPPSGGARETRARTPPRGAPRRAPPARGATARRPPGVSLDTPRGAREGAPRDRRIARRIGCPAASSSSTSRSVPSSEGRSLCAGRMSNAARVAVRRFLSTDLCRVTLTPPPLLRKSRRRSARSEPKPASPLAARVAAAAGSALDGRRRDAPSAAAAEGANANNVAHASKTGQ